MRRAQVAARFVRLQIPSPQPIFLHLDEVEIYGPADPTQNLALAQARGPEQPQHLVDFEAHAAAAQRSASATHQAKCWSAADYWPRDLTRDGTRHSTL